eukprot:5740235-Pleurochrysis_carterae.AAC.1
MGQEQQRPTTMHIDNIEAVEFSEERRSCQRSRHVDRRDLKVRKFVAHRCIKVRKIHTDENVADVFTNKALPAHVHKELFQLLAALRAPACERLLEFRAGPAIIVRSTNHVCS